MEASKFILIQQFFLEIYFHLFDYQLVEDVALNPPWSLIKKFVTIEGIAKL